MRPPDYQPALIARDARHNWIAGAELLETTTNLDLRLRPGLALGGVVQAENGAAISNATVSVDMWINDAAAEVADTATDQQGRFFFQALPPEGGYTVAVKGTASDGTLLTGAFPVAGGDTNLNLKIAFHAPGTLRAPFPPAASAVKTSGGGHSEAGVAR